MIAILLSVTNVIAATKIRHPVIALSLLAALSCSTLVLVPSPNQDVAPAININGYEVGGSGTVEKTNVSSTSTINIDLGMELAINGVAKNSGGVKNFSMTITQQGLPPLKVVASATPDANKKVPDLLSIPGTDGKGGPGSTPLKPSTLEPIVVDASASNFNNQIQAISVTYVPVEASTRKKTWENRGFVIPRFDQKLYLASFPRPYPSQANSFLVDIKNTSARELILLRNGFTELDCDNPSATVVVQPFTLMTDWTNLDHVFGSPTPTLPLTIRACV